MKKIAVLSHKADLDGILSAVIANNYIKARYDDPDIFLCDYGDIPKEFNHENYDTIYVLDFSDEELFTNPKIKNKIIWIDHHQSAINKKYDVNQYCIDKVAACRLVFQFFTNIDYSFLTKDDYIKREVAEPALVTLAGEHDIWDENSPLAHKFNFGIQELSISNVEDLLKNTSSVFLTKNKEEDIFTIRKLGDNARRVFDNILIKGSGVIEFISQTSKCIGNTKRFKQGGIIFAVFNTHIKSSLIHELEPDEDALMIYSIKNNRVYCSLRTSRDNVDVSKIAIMFGGGGHKKAARFEMEISKFFDLIN